MILTGLAFICSFCGLLFFLHDRFRIDASIAPLVAISCSTIFVYLGGLVGFLMPAAMTALAAGLAALAYELYRLLRRRWSPGGFLHSTGFWFFIVLCIGFYFQVRGMLVLHSDNFSHWSTLAKEMCVTDAFPVQGTAVWAKNYPPGSAVYIYTVCKALGYTEGHCIFAQGMMVFASLSAAFGGLRFKNAVSSVALAVASVGLLAAMELHYASLHLYNLLVDGLIAYVAVGVGMVAYRYRKDFRRCLIAVIPMIGMLSLLKSSARIFALLLTILVALLFARRLFGKEGQSRRAIWAGWGGIAAMVAAQVLLPQAWNWRVEIVFPEFSGGFSSSVGGLLEETEAKSIPFLKDVAERVLAAAFDLESINTQILLAAEMVALVALLGALLLRRSFGMIGKVWLATHAAYVAYLIELFILYAFIFEGSNTETLASFPRYYATGVLLVAIPLLVGSIYQWKQLAQGSRKQWVSLLLCGLLLGTTLLGIWPMRENMIQLVDPYAKPEVEGQRVLRNEYHERYRIIQDHIPRGAYTAVFQNTNNYFVNVLPQLEMLSREAWDITPISGDETKQETISRSDYAVNFMAYEEFCQKVQAQGYSVEGAEGQIVYTIDHSTKRFIPIT